MSIRSYLEEYSSKLDLQPGRCMDAVWDLETALRREFPAAPYGIPVFKSEGNCFQSPLRVTDIKGELHEYTHHAVLLVMHRVYDPMHGYFGVEFNKYILSAIVQATPYFRFDSAMTPGMDIYESIMTPEVAAHYHPRR